MKELKSRTSKDWLIDTGLVLIHSFFLTICFLIGFAHVYLSDMQTWSSISALRVIVVSPFFSYFLHSLGRVIAIFLLSSLVGFALESITSVVLFFDSFNSHRYLEISGGEIHEVLVSPAQLILVYTISVFFISILGGIVGDYIAERRHKGEKMFTLRCPSCGTWNEQDTLKCSFCGKVRCSSCGTWNQRDALQCSSCGKKLVRERDSAEARRRAT